ncbi:MAG: proteasome assembly chaperone family protein [Candidatus Kariarchaeaceae archaeon]|jgi:predicted ATP-grasp superfamily ATP-dependent carboligase
MTYTGNNINLHYFREDFKFNDLLVIVTHPTIGTISSIVGNYIIENLDLQLIGAFISPQMPPTAVIDKNGQPVPPVRIYAGQFNDDPETAFDQVVVIATDLPLEKEVMFYLCDEILKWSKNNNATSILTIEAINKSEIDLDNDIHVYSITTGKIALDLIQNADVEPLVDGMVSGITGLLQYKGRIANFPVISFLAEANEHFTDARSAVAVLSRLNRLIPKMQIDHLPLLKQAEHVESQLKIALARINPSSGKSSNSGLFV